ncbi:MAG: EAL domain-containing protein [Nitrospira sp.]|nr:EAL domain-containing protein [Nitrospira sp.]
MTFTCILRRAALPRREQDSPFRSVPATLEPLFMDDTPLALIVDDDVTLRDLARQALEKAGCRVNDVATGEDAVQAFQQERPHIVLLDVMMPGMDGFDTCAALRKIPGGESVPILIMTGLDDIRSITTAYDVGATDFITKPWNPLILSHRVRYMLRASQTVAALSEREASLAEAQRIAHLGNWRWHLPSDRITLSKEIFRMLEIEDRPLSSPMTFEQFLSYLSAPDLASIETGIRHAVAAGKPFQQDHRILLPSGDTRIVHHQAEIIQVQGPAATIIAGTIQDITDQKRAEATIYHLSNYDHLTQLPNRQLFRDRVTQALAIQKRHRTQGAVLLVNLNRLQRFSDTLGPKCSDTILCEAANRLLQCIRQSDTVARYNEQDSPTLSRLDGNEFIILLTHLVSTESATNVAQRILESLNAPYYVDDRTMMITAGIGIARLGEDGSDVDILLRNVEAALHAAQEQGRNTYQFYTQSMNIALAERLSLESDLYHAVARKELLLHYQPQVDIRRWEITGVEALIRWHHPRQGLIPPAAFIPLAEETGLINEIGEWVLRQACTQQVAWAADGIEHLSIAVNLSAVQFHHRSLADLAATIIHETGASPANIELELTESTAMQRAEHAVSIFRQLKTMGFRLSIDDFGTGYSSLAYLKRFPIDTIKIDQAFIKDLDAESEHAAIAVAIIAMAHGLKLQVLAEGVETPAQLEILKEYGCDAIQGYLFSQPLPGELVAQLIRTHRAKRTSPRQAA